MKNIIDYLDVIIIIVVALCLIWMYRTDLLTLIGIAALFVFAFVVEKRYVSRYGVLPNILILSVGVMKEWQNLPDLFKNYWILGVIVGIAFLIAYCKKISIPASCYKITYILFGMKNVLSLYICFLILGSFSHQFFGVLLIPVLIVIWRFGVKRCGNAPPF